MTGIYFSGTGNTRHCVGYFLNRIDSGAKAFSIEDAEAVKAIKEADSIVFGYPVQFSSLPKIVRDFIVKNKDIFSGKKIFIIATMGLFSGDGAGCSARLFKEYGAEILGGLHLKMPDNIGDEKALKKTLGQNRAVIKSADEKILSAAEALKNGKPYREGLGFLYHLAGLFGQRLWFGHKTKNYTDKLKIDSPECIGCGVCAKACPMGNISLSDGKAIAGNSCTMCYRCVSDCPKQAITLLGNTVYEQCKYEKYAE